MSWQYLAVATEAVLRAGRLQRERYASGVAVEYKGEIDLVTEVDRACEAAILETIRSRHPDHDIVTEETDLDHTGSRFVWYVDPLDGTPRGLGPDGVVGTNGLIQDALVAALREQKPALV